LDDFLDDFLDELFLFLPPTKVSFGIPALQPLNIVSK
jgi:hypothetical protein